MQITDGNGNALGDDTRPLVVSGPSGGAGLATQSVPQSTPINRSATVSTTASVLMAANASRKGFVIKNDSAVGIWINPSTTATAVAGGGNIKITAGSYYASEPNLVWPGAISAIAASATADISAWEW